MDNRYSSVWEHFTIIDGIHAKCDICKRKYSYKSTLTNLKKHLSNKHLINCSPANNPVRQNQNTHHDNIDNPDDSETHEPQPSTSGSSMAPVSSSANSCMSRPTEVARKRKQTSIIGYVPKKMTVDSKKKIDGALLKLFTKDYQPFRVVEDEGFKEFVKLLNPNYILPDRHSISKTYIPALYEKCVVEMKELVEKEAQSVCMTTDCWTSRNNESFMAITIHFIDSNFSLRSVLLGCFEFNDHHTGVNLSEKIKQTLDEWNLKKKVVLAVLDNANNIKNALNILQIKSTGCFAHTMNLVIQSSLILENSLIDQVKAIVTHFRKSTVANNKLHTYQINNGISQPKKLIQDVQTRWNSTFYIISRFVELEDSIRGTLGLLDKAPENLKGEEWIILKEMCQVLKPFEEATRVVSGEKFMTSSLVIVLSQGLVDVCSKMSKMNYNPRVLDIVNKLLCTMLEKDTWKNLEKSRTLCRSTFLDPRFKNIPFLHSTSILETTKEDIIENLTAIIRNEKNQTADRNEQIPPPDNGSEEVQDLQTFGHQSISIWDTIDRNAAEVQPSGTSTSRAIIEVQRYLEVAILQRNNDPLIWWRENSYNYPYLHILAKRTLCCLGTSVPCERVFSKAGLILNDRRCRLKNDKVKMLLFLNYNSN
ncbi:hypothetical protein QTP88_021842 [Uroleucon formosanum]